MSKASRKKEWNRAKKIYSVWENSPIIPIQKRQHLDYAIEVILKIDDYKNRPILIQLLKKFSELKAYGAKYIGIVKYKENGVDFFQFFKNLNDTLPMHEFALQHLD